MTNTKLPSATPADISRDALKTIQHITESLENALVGRLVRVTSDHNGQPYGRSKKSWRGEIRRIKSIHVDVYSGLQLSLEGHEYECFIRADEVELV